MNTSLQAACGRHLALADKSYPYRVMVWEARGDDWKLAEVFEWETLGGAELVALETCTEPYSDGVTAMHYVIGEVANG